MDDKYMRRTVDSLIATYLKIMGGVVIEGPKWCGKTRTGREFYKSILSIDSENTIKTVRMAVNNNSTVILDTEPPLLIDEWQDVPEIWDFVRFEIDRRNKNGQFILTGSSVPPTESTRHSGVGRLARIVMRPMSLFESGESNGTVSLASLFETSTDVSSRSELTLENLANALVRGGWPASINVDPDDAALLSAEYVDGVIESDITRVSNIRRKPQEFRRMIESISRNISTAANMQTILKDVNGSTGNASDHTIKKYLDAMEQIFLVENLLAWNPHLRSRTRLSTTPKWHFVDPSIATAALGISPKSLLNDYNTFGLLFESLCLRDLRVYSQALRGNVYFFRNKNGFEVDFIVEIPGGKWGAIEVKLGNFEEDKGAENLLRLRDMVDTDAMEPPSFLMILTAGTYGYRRPDGILVVPIGCLKD